MVCLIFWHLLLTPQASQGYLGLLQGEHEGICHFNLVQPAVQKPGHLEGLSAVIETSGYRI